MTDNFLADLDLLGTPLFRLRAQADGPIKGRYAAPKNWQKRTADQNDRALLAQPGDAVAMVCGQAYDVLDVDPRNGGSVEALRVAGPIPRVHHVVATPSGGWHLYVSPLSVGKGKLPPGVDLQGAGRFVLAPPTEGYRLLPRADWPDLGTPQPEADARVARQEPEAPSGDAPGDTRTFEELSATEQADTRTRPERVRDAGARRLAAAVDWPEGRTDDLGRGWQRLTADYAFNLAQLGAATWCPYSLADAEADFRANVPDDLAAALDLDDIWRGQVGQARRKPTQPGGAEDWGPLPEDAPPAVTAEAPTGVLARFQRTSLATLLDPSRPPREYVVDPMIAAGTSVALVAPAGHRKSLVLLALALKVARGDDDFAGMAIPRARRVLYVDMENTEDDLRERLLSFGVQPGDTVDNFILVSLPRMDPLDTAKGGAAFMEAVRAFRLEPGDLVVLDSYQRITEAGENDSDTTRGYYRHTGVHLKARGLTVVRTDNTGKDPAKGARGSSGKRDDVDVEYLLQSKGDQIEVRTGKVRQRGLSNLLLTVHTDDGGHTTFVSGLRPARARAVDDVIAWLDANDVPLDASAREAERQSKAAGENFTRGDIRQATKTRQERADDFAQDD